MLTPENPPVVDASVAVKWFLPEVHAEFARRLIEEEQFAGGQRLRVPELFFAEVGNILWKHMRREEITLERAQIIVETVTDLPFEVYGHSPLLPAALVIASETQRTVYDSLYLALAVSEQTILITADERLYNALQNTPLAAYLAWVEEIEVTSS